MRKIKEFEGILNEYLNQAQSEICWACGKPATEHEDKVTINNKALHKECLFRAALVEQIVKEAKK